MPVAFGGKPDVLIDANRTLKAASRGEMRHQRCGERSVLPETHALREIASIVRQSHGETQQVELSVTFNGPLIENCLFAIDFSFDGGLRFFRGSRVTEFKHAPEATRDRTPMLAVVTADTANGAD